MIADMEAEIEFIKSRSVKLIEDAKDMLEETVDELKSDTAKQVDANVGNILEERLNELRIDTDKMVFKFKKDISELVKDSDSTLASKVADIKSSTDSSIASLKASFNRTLEQFNSLKGASKQQIKQAKDELSGIVNKSIKQIESDFSTRIKSIEDDLFKTVDDIETLKKTPSGVPADLIKKINSFVVQRSVNIPVTYDQGGLGTTQRPTVGQVPVANADGTYTPGDVTVDVTATNTVTLTNKRITPRVNTITSSATPTINTDTTDIFTITALAAAITSMTTNLSGTPTTGQKLEIRILDNNSARAITWGSSFSSRGVTLPTTTTANKYLRVLLEYNEVAAVWDCIGVCAE
jgi:F0F1-type ATP synthase membrane subunit b/b'